MASAQTEAMQAWLQLAMGVATAGQDVFQKLNQADVLLNANRLRALIVDAEPGSAVGGVPIEAVHVQSVLRMLDSFHAWTRAPLDGEGGDTPEDVLFRRWDPPSG